MPFFSRSSETAAEEPTPVAAPPATEEPRHFSLFGGGGSTRRQRPASPAPSGLTDSTSASANYNTTPDRRASTASSTATSGKSSRSFLHKLSGGGVDTIAEMDPSIVGARERVMAAEKAERDADQALAAARARVCEARDQVRKLEMEAEEEARRARLKQYHAREVSKRGNKLGRHDL